MLLRLRSCVATQSLRRSREPFEVLRWLVGDAKQFTARTVGGAKFFPRRPANEIATLKNKDGRPNSVDGRICT